MELINRHIRNLPPYNAGLHMSRFRAQFGRDCLAKLDSNENPYGPSPAAQKAVLAAANDLARYPDGNGSDLRSELAKLLDHDAMSIVLGNGSEDLIYAAYSAVLSLGDHVVTVTPGFGLHELAAVRLNVRVRKIRYLSGWLTPMDDLVGALESRPKIFAISSPSNPLGTVLPLSELDRLLAATTPDTLFLFDEAYFEYLPDDIATATLGLLKQSEANWISLRTFSKAYGLAGLRVGYAICKSQAIAVALRSMATPFNVNAVAQRAASAALTDKAHLADVVSRTRRAREALVDGLRRLGLEPAPSHSNAVFFRTEHPSAGLVARLRENGVLVKPWGEEGWSDYLRVSTGTDDEVARFLDVLKCLNVAPGHAGGAWFDAGSASS